MENDLRLVMTYVGKLSGQLSYESRAQTFHGFGTDKYKVLVTTDMFIRAVDIPDVVCVISVDPPVDEDGKVNWKNNILRITRCGRFGKWNFLCTS